MSQKYLSNVIRNILKQTNVTGSKALDTIKEKLKTSSYLTEAAREAFKTDKHVLTISIADLKEHAEKALGIISPGETLTDDKLKAFLEKNTAKPIKQVVVPGKGASFEIVFDNFRQVRYFLDKIGLFGRAKTIQKYVLESPSLVRRIKSELTKAKIPYNDSTFSNAANLNKALAEIKDSKVYRDIRKLELGFDVGHNVPVAYSVIEIIAQNKIIVDQIIARAYGQAGPISPEKLNRISENLTNSLKSGKIAEVLVSEDFVIYKEEGSQDQVRVFIEGTYSNIKGSSEAKIYDAVAKELGDLVAKEFQKDAAETLANLYGSRSPKQKLIDATVEATLTGKTTIAKQKTKSKGSAKASIKVPAAAATKKPKAKTKTKKQLVFKSTEKSSITEGVTAAVSSALRTPGGRFISLTNVEALIRSMLTQAVMNNMERPNLRNQTGRFAGSVELKDLQKTREGELIAFLTYMKYPYQTFEPGYAQGFRGYDPRRLISQSVREIAVGLVKNRLRTVIV